MKIVRRVHQLSRLEFRLGHGVVYLRQRRVVGGQLKLHAAEAQQRAVELAGAELGPRLRHDLLGCQVHRGARAMGTCRQRQGKQP